MKAFKVENYGSCTFIPVIKTKMVEKFTGTRVYFKNGRFQNLECTDRFFPHKWFEKKKDAEAYIDRLLYKKENYLRSNLTKVQAVRLKRLMGVQ